MTNRVLGVIGGSGIYDLPGLANLEEHSVETPFGSPSSKLMLGTMETESGDVTMVFLARHGEGHTLLPHEINYRANVYALKQMGVDYLVSLSAVGSMREDVRPGDILIVDQYIDRTHGRESTFFGSGCVAHIAFGEPVSPVLAKISYDIACEQASACGRDVKVHSGGTYLAMNGPQFSTRAESLLYRSWGVDVIGMTNMPEAKLAREAQISYCTLALSTDYDCWHEDEDDVSVTSLLEVLKYNSELAKEIVAKMPHHLPAEHTCIAATALDNAIFTPTEAISSETEARLGPILSKYLSSRRNVK
ncbi:MAG: S-methyl-5'-thioadenosine phosphorylase [Myxococcales bacterium]|nr:S-methyl-5'-thioadenosine phosphorylase [Myxococcales bacterium]